MLNKIIALSFLLITFYPGCFSDRYNNWGKGKDGSDVLIASYMFDDNADGIRKIIKDKYHLDPAKIPNITETIPVPLYDLKLNLTNGWVYGASTLTRIPHIDFLIKFLNGRAMFVGRFNYAELKGYFNYSYFAENSWTSSLSFRDEGTLNVTVRNVTFRAGFLYNISTLKITDTHLKIFSFETPDIQMKSNLNGLDSVKNYLSKIIIPFFHERIVNISTSNALLIANLKMIMPLNENMLDILMGATRDVLNKYLGIFG